MSHIEVTVRIPVEVYDYFDRLARNGHVNVSSWIQYKLNDLYEELKKEPKEAEDGN